MTTKAMVLLIDGAVAEYLNPVNAPRLNQLATQGGNFVKTVTAQLPSVTNVNHARILTGADPVDNGINGNIFFDPQTGNKTFIESARYLNVPTIFNRLSAVKRTSALLTVKGKIDQVFGDGATYRLNAEAIDQTLLTAINAPLPPAIDSLTSGRWVVEAARALIAAKSPDFVYAATNDYVMHHFAPTSSQAHDFIRGIDEQLAAIHALEPERTIYVVADHGMNAKPTLINLEQLLQEHQLSTDVLLPLADRYLENHQYQESGSAYVYLHRPDQLATVKQLLETVDGVEQVWTRAEAATRFHLDPQRIGDLFVLASKPVAFGYQPTTILHDYPGRSHGSAHELTVPLFCLRSDPTDPDQYRTSRDLYDQLQLALQF